MVSFATIALAQPSQTDPLIARLRHDAAERPPVAWDFITLQWRVSGSAIDAGDATTQKPLLRWEGRIARRAGAMATRWAMISQIDDTPLLPIETRHILLPDAYFRSLRSDLPYFQPYQSLGSPGNYQSMIVADEASGCFLEGWLGVLPAPDWLAMVGAEGAAEGTTLGIVDGHRCHVLQSGGSSDAFKFWIDEESGVLRKASRIQTLSKQGGARGLLSQARGDTRLDRVERELSQVRAELIGEHWFSTAGQMITTHHFADGSRFQQITRTERRNIVWNAAEADLFSIPDPVVVYADGGYLPKERQGGELRPYIDPAITRRISALEQALAKAAGASADSVDDTYRKLLAQGDETARLAEPVGEALAAGVAVAAALRLAGAETEFVGLLPERWPKADIRLEDLAQAARERGFYAQPLRRLDARDLAQVQTPAILFLKRDQFSRRPNYFAALAGTAGDRLLLFDAVNGLQAVSWQSLTDRWGGAGLAVSREEPRLPFAGGWFMIGYGAPLMIGLLVLGTLTVCSRRRWARRMPPILGQAVECAAMAALAVPLAWAWNAGYPAGAFANRTATANVHAAHYGDLAPVTGDAEMERLVALDGSEGVVIDARIPNEFAIDHIPGAINLPLDIGADERRAATSDWPRDRRLVVYCGGESCNIAEYMASRLATDGFTNIEIYKGGLEGWNALMRHR